MHFASLGDKSVATDVTIMRLQLNVGYCVRLTRDALDPKKQVITEYDYAQYMATSHPGSAALALDKLYEPF